ncbi:unnamed protein product (macronuclear) [Paramecium tetraurelia]|uniref:Uncharacterized protein n=1 Tax=Paramecium tetraurelia TaxID=5888 RepID=A0BBG7_PARTE|nr:uncharacterized protein GSPATT00000319001 [Paramecium tetraurelia]CAK55884.1 unnamed protein product [Paramecium tetraurelia]|eukprot:XP_001423282.1 hypothetical protein (macronuclear) [Paramecium tetraurelia strain d4-2]
MQAQYPAVVIDNGSGYCKIGIAGDDAPTSCFPAIVGRSKQNDEYYVGEEAQAKRGVLAIKEPIQNGIINSWDDIEIIWHHAFYNELCMSPEDQPVFMTDAPMNSKFNRERMTQIMFETFNTPCLYISNEAVLSLYTSGKTIGLVVDSGEGVTHCVPVFEGHQIPQAITKINLAGRLCTDYLTQILQELGYSLTEPHQRIIVKNIKERLCYTALDPQDEKRIYKESNSQDSPYKLPDGNILTIKSQKFRCSEILFQPKLIGLEVAGIHHLAYSSIKKCDLDLRQELCRNIVLSGGTTLFPGIANRLSNELTNLVPSQLKIQVAAPPDRRFSAWIGGSIQCTLSTQQPQWIKRQEYDEQGPSIVHRKCF